MCLVIVWVAAIEPLKSLKLLLELLQSPLRVTPVSEFISLLSVLLPFRPPSISLSTYPSVTFTEYHLWARQWGWSLKTGEDRAPSSGSHHREGRPALQMGFSKCSIPRRTDSQSSGDEQKGHLGLESRWFLKNRTELSLKDTGVVHRYGSYKPALHGNALVLHCGY